MSHLSLILLSTYQTSGPQYKFLISEVGGEKRFAAAVAKRLALLGALTQGDRRATGQSNALGLANFDFDNKFGTKALRKMLDEVWSCTTSAHDSEATDQVYVHTLQEIDAHLIEVLKQGDNWQANLAPYSDDSQSEQTYYKMMEKLLLGPCLQLATSRVEACKDNRGIPTLFDNIANGGDKDEIRPKIDEEVKSAKEKGLNFHVLCFIWLFEVGVTQQTSEGSKYRAPINVPKFLNRILGMNLKRQQLMTDHFLKYLGMEVRKAKLDGVYDIGIKTMSGHELRIEKPRAFCFRGLEAKDEKVLLYKIVRDRGMESSAALELYNEAKALEENDEGANSAPTGGFFFGRQRPIKTGFYFDKRKLTDGSPLFKETGKRVFLIINSGLVNCVVARPNYGKFLTSKDWVKEYLLQGPPRLSLVADVQEAVTLWDAEFKAANRPFTETYQTYCKGRHTESFVFSGSVVPVLNKIIVSARHISYNGGETQTLPAIVRVEPPPSTDESSTEGDAGATNDALADESADDDDDEPATEPAVGQKVAIEMLGSSIFRGKITEYKEEEEGDEESGGIYVAKFTDGSELEMSTSEAKEAMEMFNTEVSKLMGKAKMQKADASNTEVHAAVCSTAQVSTRRPVLEEGEEDDIEESEKIYEEEYDGVVPKMLVGLEFQRDPVSWYSASAQESIRIPFYQYVLRKLAEKLRGTDLGDATVMSTRELLNHEKAALLKNEANGGD